MTGPDTAATAAGGAHRENEAILADIEAARRAVPVQEQRYAELVAELRAACDHTVTSRRARPGRAERAAAGRRLVAEMVAEWEGLS